MRLITVAFALLACFLSISLMSQPTQKGEVVTSEQLGGEDRLLIFVATDKPIYRSKEKVFIRATVLHAMDNTPLANPFSVSLQIHNPKGEIVHSGYARGDNSVAGLQWQIPDSLPGGEYTAKVNSPDLGIPTSERKFDIRAYRVPRINSQIVFLRDGYGPGDLVQASVKIERAEGGIPRGAKISAIARLDGEQVFTSEKVSVDAEGQAYVEFSLPESIDAGEGSLTFVIEDGGVVETASKTLPIVLPNVAIQFFPEGGELIAGIDNRVYIQATRPNGKPADIEGHIVRLDKDKVAQQLAVDTRTSHEGRGVFTFQPELEVQYALRVTSPSGISQPFNLPPAKKSGATVFTGEGVFSFAEPIKVEVQGADLADDVSVTLYKREQPLDKQSISNTSERAQVSLNPGDAEGVLMVTVWSNGLPVAERLVYRKPKYQVTTAVQFDRERYVPGETVNLTVLTTDASGNPVEAVVGLTVTDDSVLEMIDKREQAPRLPAMVYVENEVKDLADARVYLDHNNPESDQALDLLLATQGWRRFVLTEYATLVETFPNLIKRIMATKEPPPRLFDARMMPQAVRAEAVEEIQVMGIREKADDLAVQAAPQEQPPMLNDEQVMGVAAAPMVEAKKAQAFAARRALEAEADMQPAVVREYAHKARPNRQPNDRRDFTETVYWHKGIQTSARDGKAQVRFELSDNITTFKVFADAFGRNGALGANEASMESVEPFYIEPKLPLSATVGDVMEIPVAMVNASSETLTNASLLLRADGLNVPAVEPISLKAGERARQVIRVPLTQPGTYQLTFSAAAGKYADKVMRPLVVYAKGFPISLNRGGLLHPDKGVRETLVIPDAVEPGSLVVSAKVHPSPLASMEEALNALLRQPHGCFEQSSSTNYPLVMAQQYFLSHQGVSPQKISEARTLLEQGYKKLISFESKQNGYEWFGGNPAHEALTAYGLMEFVDMQKVMEIDDAMVTRTREWLLSRRDGDGGFKRNDKALDSFGRAPAPTTNAYIVWALLESGESADKLRDEIAAVKKEAQTTKDTYVIALAANILYLANDSGGATQLIEQLNKAVDKDGAVMQAVTSITRSGGDALTIETTSLAILAWLKDYERWAMQVEKSIQWLFERSKAGRFGSTQSTVLALKAINAYDQARAKPKQPGSVQLLVDGQAFGHPVKFDQHSKGAIELPDFSAALTAGEHQIELRMHDGSKMPYAIAVQYNTALPPSVSQPPVRLTSKLSETQLLEGNTVELNTTIEVGDEDAPTPVAIVGIPAGLEVRHEKLKELVAARRISSYQVLDRDLVLYWRALRAGQRLNLPLEFTAAIPGTYTGPASRAYLYYTDEQKYWHPGSQVTIKSR